MQTRLTQAKYRCKQGCGCKMCKPQKGGHQNRRTVRDVKLSSGHSHELSEASNIQQLHQCP